MILTDFPRYAGQGFKIMGITVDGIRKPVMDLSFSALTTERWAALEDLFGRAGASNGCW